MGKKVLGNTGLSKLVSLLRSSISSLRSEMNTKLAGKSDTTHTHSTYASSSHTHDDRYYTESEIDTKLSGKSDTSHTHTGYASTSHNHDSRYYTESEIDSKLSGESTYNMGYHLMANSKVIASKNLSVVDLHGVLSIRGTIRLVASRSASPIDVNVDNSTPLRRMSLIKLFDVVSSAPDKADMCYDNLSNTYPLWCGEAWRAIDDSSGCQNHLYFYQGAIYFMSSFYDEDDGDLYNDASVFSNSGNRLVFINAEIRHTYNGK